MPIELKAKRPEVTVEGGKKVRKSFNTVSKSQGPEIETKLLSHGAFLQQRCAGPAFFLPLV